MGRRSNRSKKREREVETLTGAKPTKKKKRKRAPFDPDKHLLPNPVPDRAHEPCPISGEPIDDILTAITHPASGKPARFDAVLRSIEERESLGRDERIAYIGKGMFGVIAMEENADGRQELVVKKRIPYEDGHDKQDWRRELAPGISRDYPPEPRPLSELYSSEELSSFPRFEAGGSMHISRNN
jgi:hypothetical protein